MVRVVFIQRQREREREGTLTLQVAVGQASPQLSTHMEAGPLSPDGEAEPDISEEVFSYLGLWGKSCGLRMGIPSTETPTLISRQHNICF